MKRTIAWILVLVLCLGVFAGCTKTPVASTNPGTTAGAAENEGLQKAAKYLKALYNTAPVETGVDFERTTIVPVGTVQYTVTWAVDVAEDLVKIVAGENNTVVIDVNEDNQTETAYKLTATVSDKDGNKKEVVFDHILPKAVAKDGTEFSVAEIIAMGAAKEHNTYTDYKYKVTGVITEVYNTQYGNMKITDDAGNILTIYGTFSADGTLRYDAMDVKPVAGDTVTIYGIVGQYNGTPQIKNGWIVAHTPGEGGTTEDPTEPSTPADPTTPTEPKPTDPVTPPASDPAADSTLSVKDAINLALSKEHNIYTTGKYYVTGKITEIYNTQYGNMKITDDAGNILTIYGTYSADGSTRFDAMSSQPKVGDDVTIYGIIGQFNGTPQIKNGWIVKINGSAPSTEPVTPPAPPASNLSVVDSITVGKAYKFGMVQGNLNATYYLAGGMSGFYMATTTDASAALDVYVEETTGGYYLYAMISGTKTYISMVKAMGTDGKEHINGKYETAPSTVYTWDAEAKTLVADIDGEAYWHGTRSDKSYNTVGPCAVSFNGFYCQFYA
jgi:DNA/RNA endonuclease YhcR with UshA esterase domain